MRRGLLLWACVLCCIAHADAPPHIDFEVTPAWKGWTRPGRTTELDIRLRSDGATAVQVDVSAGRQTLHSRVDLQPGRVVRLQMPVPAAASVAVSARAVGPQADGGLAVDAQAVRGQAVVGPPAPARELALAQSESPLLAVGVAAGDATVTLDGFHGVALAADDLPRHASAYSSIDAIVVDAATLAALDQRQLAALLSYADGCGRIAVLGGEPRLRQLLEGAGGCGGRYLFNAGSAAQASELLGASLTRSAPLPLASGRELVRPALAAWDRVALGCAVVLAAALLVVTFASSLPLLLAVPVLACLAVLALLQAMPTTSQLVVWSEGQSGAAMAHYQAWQRYSGSRREPTRVAVPAQLGAAAQPCDAGQPLQLELDADEGRVTHAAFETRLFRDVWLCYFGSFPMARDIALHARSDGPREVRNIGSRAWPAGTLMTGGRAHELPALTAGAAALLGAPLPNVEGATRRDAVLTTALARTPADGAAALWRLDLAGVADAPVETRGWLLVTLPPR